MSWCSDLHPLQLRSAASQVKAKKKIIQTYFPIQFSPGLVDCRQPYGEREREWEWGRALETSHYRSYITCLTAAILPCFHFNHECSCVGRTARLCHVNSLKAGRRSAPPGGCLTFISSMLYIHQQHHRVTRCRADRCRTEGRYRCFCARAADVISYFHVSHQADLRMVLNSVDITLKPH